MIDHLVYGTPDLKATVAELGDRLGIALSEGGQHLGLGTRNYLADLGEGRYLEVVGPDLSQPEPATPRFFGVDHLDRARLVTWAVRVDDIDAVRATARSAGIDVPAARDMRRDSADGAAITWRMTPPMSDDRFGGLVPFVISWGDSPHPSDRAAKGLRLTSLTAFTPEPDALRVHLAALGESVDLATREAPGLEAVLETPAGRVVLD